MEVWNPFNPFKQVSAKQKIKDFAHRISCKNAASNQNRKDKIELDKIKKPIYKSSLTT